MKLFKTMKNTKKKGQTALEYAMVTVAISLVLLGAWNVVGDRVTQIIKGQMLGGITNQLTKGNNAVSR